MSIYPAVLDQLATAVADAVGVPATRDPSELPALVAGPDGGCLFIGFPTTVTRLLGGPVLTVPVSLVAPGAATLSAADWLLARIDSLLDVLGESSTSTNPLDIGELTFPAVTVTARIALEVPSP